MKVDRWMAHQGHLSVTELVSWSQPHPDSHPGHCSLKETERRRKEEEEAHVGGRQRSILERKVHYLPPVLGSGMDLKLFPNPFPTHTPHFSSRDPVKCTREQCSGRLPGNIFPQAELGLGWQPPRATCTLGHCCCGQLKQARRRAGHLWYPENQSMSAEALPSLSTV